MSCDFLMLAFASSCPPDLNRDRGLRSLVPAERLPPLWNRRANFILERPNQPESVRPSPNSLKNGGRFSAIALGSLGPCLSIGTSGRELPCLLLGSKDTLARAALPLSLPRESRHSQT